MAMVRRGLFAVALLGVSPRSALASEEELSGILDGDDECAAGTECAVSALQLKAVQLHGKETQPEKVPEPAVAADDSDSLELGQEEALPSEGQDWLQPGDDASSNVKGQDALQLNEEEASAKAMWGSGWYIGGDKLWGRGSGTEVINSMNANYYNAGMRDARNLCGGPSCTLLTNPRGHRTKEVFHIHFFHYHGHYASSLKHKLESRTCGKPGWHSGGLPCHGKATFVSGFPGVFSVASGGGGMGGASVIAWPSSCGGRGTIVQLAYGCSIEHQIRGDFNPAKR